MANKRVTSAPLFGSASREDIADIQREIRNFTAKVVGDETSAKDLLRRTGVTLPEGAKSQGGAGDAK